MGNAVFTSTYTPSGQTVKTVNARITYNEKSYDIATRKTTIEISKIEFQVVGNTTNWGSCRCYGSVTANGTTLVTLGGGQLVALSDGGYHQVSTFSSSTAEVTHNADGTGSFTLGVVGGIVDSGVWYFAAKSNDSTGALGVTGQSKTVQLTTRPVYTTLTVNPNGGVWNSSSSAQTFSDSTGATKTIANPTRTGYTFTSWTKSGGGTFAGTTFTYGNANATLTAGWNINTWAVSYDANGGSGAPASQTKTYNQTLTLSSTVPTRTGYTFKGWGTSSSATTPSYQPEGSYTANAAAVLYAIWQKITYTLTLTTSGTGVAVNVLRTSSPIGGASSGLLSNGATLYHNDVIKISYAVSSGYMLSEATVNSTDISGVTEYTVSAVTGNLSVKITVDVGAIVYIANQPYQAYIGDGSNWRLYKAYIGNGSSFDGY